MKVALRVHTYEHRSFLSLLFPHRIVSAPPPPPLPPLPTSRYLSLLPPSSPLNAKSINQRKIRRVGVVGRKESAAACTREGGINMRGHCLASPGGALLFSLSPFSPFPPSIRECVRESSASRAGRSFSHVHVRTVRTLWRDAERAKHGLWRRRKPSRYRRFSLILILVLLLSSSQQRKRSRDGPKGSSGLRKTTTTIESLERARVCLSVVCVRS